MFETLDNVDDKWFRATISKRDLKSCTILQKSSSLPSKLAWNAHQVDAIIHFSSHKLSGVELSTHRSKAKHTLQDCESLFALILGKT